MAVIKRETGIVVLGIMFMAAQAIAGDAPILKTEQERESYVIGVGVARNLQRQNIEVDMDSLVRGLKDAQGGGKLLLTDIQIRTIMTKIQAVSRQKQEQAREAAAVENKKSGEAFLAQNRKKEGITTLPSGLQYKILKAGDGKKPTAADKVECRYRGTLLNGQEFDNSERSGQATVTFEVKGLVAGVREALLLMPVGSRWQLFIPSELAYGERGTGADIGPNATLIFEMELVAIK